MVAYLLGKVFAPKNNKTFTNGF